jgi:surfactin synthase thioesterase subunit
MVGDEDPRASAAEVRAWQEHTTGPFDMKVFGGGHFYLNNHVADVTELVASRITAFQGENL